MAFAMSYDDLVVKSRCPWQEVRVIGDLNLPPFAADAQDGISRPPGCHSKYVSDP